ncbi:MAG: histidinol dehydrogenase [Acidimicrobiales bacterium]
MLLRNLDRRGQADPAADLPRPEISGDDPVDAVRTIIADVRGRGDAAVRELGLRFDGVVPDPLTIPQDDMHAALAGLDGEVVAALELAARRIGDFHRLQMPTSALYESEGVTVRSRAVPVDRAGVYVPGGRAVYPSTVLMTAIPARVAGVAEIAMCVPPGADGTIPAVTLAAAAVAGVDEVHPIGGAQAIAALAYGTDSVRPVDVIAGPGNVFVAIAKREVAGDVGVAAAFAGPSEVVVIADASADPRLVAIDIALQAEHGPDGLAWLITWDPAVADAVGRELATIVEASPRRAEIEATLDGGGYAVLVDGPDAALAVANAIAPEHLEIQTADPASLADGVRHAGAVFCGPWAPASIGDYVAGPSHVLPTDGTARFAGALTVHDFLKDLHVVTLDRAGLEAVGPAAATLADAEGLAAHALSIRARLQS